MAASSIEICNMMLTWLSRKQIVSFDDNTKESNFCKFNYDISRRTVLESREWSFATLRSLLPPLVGSPVYGYQYAFLVPPTSLRVLGVYDPGRIGDPDAPIIKHKIELNEDGKKVILANLSSIHVRYIYDQKTTQLFSPLFDQTLASYMGYSAAVPLTQDKDQQSRMFSIYKDNLDEATFNDSVQGSREMLEISKLEQSRRMFYRIG